MGKIFVKEGRRYADEYAEKGYVHIPGAVSEEFLRILSRQTEEYLANARLARFAVGDKQQALYDFPERSNYQELLDLVAAVCGMDSSDLVISERHIKAYEAEADPKPLAHKDRFSSEISVGISVEVPKSSTLILYPQSELDVNPYSSSTEYRVSIPPNEFPDPVLRRSKRVEIQDVPGDMVLFRGNRIWHLRENAANTRMIYFKLNSFNSDPLGEDPRTPDIERRSRTLRDIEPEEFAKLVPVWGRRMDYIQRRVGRDGREIVSAVLWGRPPASIDEQEWKALRLVDGERDANEIAAEMGLSRDGTRGIDKLRRLASLGAVDLLPPSPVMARSIR